ncbi:hypothetical protein CDAR_75941 [Caerostris darwini]|uniref:Uncharacterized protein n=1 Tax=Caerostris darwini TaxID=1538125 RepID=A0AAV4Q9H2_9ARAC|nr:hypothetical protein CDAR_75941 [Caerostris darwini]
MRRKSKHHLTFDSKETMERRLRKKAKNICKTLHSSLYYLVEHLCEVLITINLHSNYFLCRISLLFGERHCGISKRLANIQRKASDRNEFRLEVGVERLTMFGYWGMNLLLNCS